MGIYYFKMKTNKLIEITEKEFICQAKLDKKYCGYTDNNDIVKLYDYDDSIYRFYKHSKEVKK